jgi:hypothetical protein
LNASVELCAVRGKEKIKYTDRVFIPEGFDAGDSRTDVSDNDLDLVYYIYYYSGSLFKSGYAQVAYLTESGTNADAKKEAVPY